MNNNCIVIIRLIWYHLMFIVEIIRFNELLHDVAHPSLFLILRSVILVFYQEMINITLD